MNAVGQFGLLLIDINSNSS